jgi:MOSC domain-containing protein YiiM
MERASCSASDNDPARGAVVAVSIDSKHRFSKTNRLSIILTAGLGVEGDAHYGRFVRHRHLARRNPTAPNLRQVHLMSVELFDVLWTSGYKVQPRDLGENITTVGLDLESFLWIRCFGSATRRISDSPGFARLASSSIVSSQV